MTAPTLVGSIQVINSNGQSGSQSVTVPAGADLCLLCAAYYDDALTGGINTASLNGASFTSVVEIFNNIDYGGTTIWRLNNPTTGTFSWSWDMTFNATYENAVMFLVFLDNVDVSGNPIRASATGQGASTATSGSFASNTNDLSLCVGYSFDADCNAAAGSNQTERANGENAEDPTYSNFGAIGTKPGVAGTTTMAVSGSGCSICAVSILGTTDGTQYNQSISGAVSPAGALSKQGRKVLAGAAGPTGSLVKQIGRAWAGAITPAGSLATIRTVLIALAGAVAPAGALLKRTGKGLAGATAPAGVLARQINKSLAARLFLNAGYCLRFYGNGTGQIDRVRIALDPGGSSTPVDIGAGDFTIECWLNCLYANNTSTSIGDARYSNIFLDRDIYGHERGFVAGVTRRSGPILAVCFGVAGAGLTWTTIYGTTQVGDGNWHHVAIVRRQSTGAVQLYVDGVLDASGTYTTGDLSYPDGYDPGIGQDNPYIVLGTEKHDVGVGYNGLMDELRISDSRRYTAAFTPPGAAFSPDANTVGLYHCNDVAGTVLRDSATVAGAPTDGELLVGGSPSGPEWVVSTAFDPLSIVRILLLTLTGAIAPSGAIARQVRKVLAGAVTPVGDLSRQIRKALAGTVTPAGTLSSIKTILLVLAGAVAPAGNLIKQSVSFLAGAVAPAGSLAKQTRRGLSGSMTPAGSLALIKTILLALTGEISPAGILARQTAKTLAGAMAPVGEISKLAQRVLTGAIAPSGAVSSRRIISLLVDGIVTPAGVLARETRKALAGAVTPAGSLVKRIAIALGGIIGPGGSLAAVLSMAMALRELTLRDRTLTLTLHDRTISLTIRDRR